MAGMYDDAQADFIAQEISIAFTLHRSAQLAYSMGHTEHADQARDHALAAYTTVHRLVEKLKSPSTNLENEIDRLQSVLRAHYPERFL